MKVATLSSKQTPRVRITDLQIKKFKEAVARHCQNKLPPLELQRLRKIANKNLVIEESLDDIINQGLADQALSIEETLVPFKSSTTIIGKIEDAPLYYVERSGFYLWSVSPHNAYALTVWLTYPAYPEGW